MNEEMTGMQLEDQLCFPLYACSREVIKHCRPELDALGLTYTQYIVMLVIWAEKTVSVRDLGRRLYLDSGTLTPVLKTMEKNGLITRRRSQEDERVLMVTVTQQGMDIQPQAQKIPGVVTDSLGLTQEERAVLHTLLYKILASSGEA